MANTQSLEKPTIISLHAVMVHGTSAMRMRSRRVRANVTAHAHIESTMLNYVIAATRECTSNKRDFKKESNTSPSPPPHTR